MNDFLDLAMNLAMDGRTLTNLRTCDRNFDRICLMRNIFALRRVNDKFVIPNPSKNDKKSENFRLLGNKLFSVEKWFGALEYYNKSICFATKNSEQLAIGYANRSAVYLELKEYKLCLDNISLARAAALPGRLMNKLNQREADCLRLMETDGNGNQNNSQLGKEELQLSRTAHSQVPFIVDCLEMKRNLEHGRHIVTNEDLKPGEIIAIEDAFVCGLDESFNYRRCTYCTKENVLSLISCDVCTNTMFCSDCVNDAKEDFHKIECPISAFLAAFENTRFVLRLVLRALKSFTSAEDLIGVMKESPEHTVFSFDQAETLNAKEKYLPVHSLVTNDDKQSDIDELFRAMYSTILCEKLICNTSLKEIWPIDTDFGAKMVLADVINHCFEIVPQNGHKLTSYGDNKETEEFGGAIYPFASLLNHACSPNVFRVTHGTKLILMVLRNIKKGEQLLDCYAKRYSSKTVTQKERRESIKQTLHFDCRCIACVNNFPLRTCYKCGNIPAVSIVVDDIKQQTVNCSQYLEKYDSKYPCVEVDAAQEVLIGCMNDLYGNKSAKCNFKTMD
ncbi:SET and MYND domain-containing protein 4-like [Bradysia coprophila]|uniref:SET and MYND domain-containing protein 4-like n=1 Tax=Bradysia coprophila TaxID=38358 RepID=UPI00187DC8BC|nr:SET and MYND domain-containing protein 4-like [Bradysia coprophila]